MDFYRCECGNQIYTRYKFMYTCNNCGNKITKFEKYEKYIKLDDGNILSIKNV